MLGVLVRPCLRRHGVAKRVQCHYMYHYRQYQLYQQQYSHDAPCPTLVEEASSLFATQHAHKDGPWQAMTKAAKAQYEQHCSTKETAQTEFQVLDLACGPRGEPASTIARALPNAKVHCTDLCEVAIAAVPVRLPDTDTATDSDTTPANLSKSVAGLTDLSAFPNDTFDVVTCCYGYNLIEEHDFPKALEEAHRVLKHTGILIVVNWERSQLHYIGRDVMNGVRRGYAEVLDDNDEMDHDSLFLHSMAVAPPDPIALSSGTCAATGFSRALEQAGFLRQFMPVETIGTYPFNLGSRRNPLLNFFIGTFTARNELLLLGALTRDKDAAGGWSCLAEQVFWTSIRKYTKSGSGSDLDSGSDRGNNDDNHHDTSTGTGHEETNPFWIHGNQYKMSILRKARQPDPIL